MTDTSIAYSPCCSFEHWAACNVDVDLFTKLALRIDTLSSGEFAQDARWAQDRILRATAYETGAVENLYDEGATYTVAMEKEGWESELAQSGDGASEHFADQLRAYFLIREWAEKPSDRPLAEVDIRELHSTATRSQQTYPVQTTLGTEQQGFVSGAYKTQENRVVGRDGAIHSYAPPIQVAPEMEKLISTCRSQKFLSAHPVLQCAYIHWSIAHIHPFADGNGRVARVFSSLPLIKTYGVPFVVYASKKRRYLQSLEAADNHHHQEMVDYVSARLASTMSYLAELMETARSEERAENSLQSIQELLEFQKDRLETREEAAIRVRNRFVELVQEEAESKLSKRGIQVQLAGNSPLAYNEFFYHGGYRQAEHSVTLRLSVETVSQHHSVVDVSVGYAVNEGLVPIVVQALFGGDNLYFRLEDCSPDLSVETELRLRNLAVQAVSTAAQKLQHELEEILREHGQLPSPISVNPVEQRLPESE